MIHQPFSISASSPLPARQSSAMSGVPQIGWPVTFIAGTQLTGHVASFFTVRDGRIVRHETFDCYEPFERNAAPTNG